ncbi:MAG: thiamine ABC transporter substrate-binding protein [Spirochaetaceae bacterium]|nr:thiamine ABC transporter substrate-binding protein [Spirochaetaceae bacterium]
MKISYHSILPVQAAILLLCFSFLACNKNSNKTDGIVICTYDSFISRWGPGEEIAKRFKEQTGTNITWKSYGDSGTLAARILLDGKAQDADIVLGLDQNLAEKVIQTGLFEKYDSAGFGKVLEELRSSEVLKSYAPLIPYDYSFFSIIYDSDVIANPPENLEDLTQYKNKLILMDPGSSSPGLGFLAWTISAYGDLWQDYWKRLKGSILTTASGWDQGYGLFTEGEAPLVLSYTTSPAYHREYENTDRYRAALFSDGHPIQIELAGIFKTSHNMEQAKKFIDFMLSESFQELIPLGNWMYPVIDIPLPESFALSEKPKKIIWTKPVSRQELDIWQETMR